MGGHNETMTLSRKFAYLTNDGELILLAEFAHEVHSALTARGIGLDMWQLTCVIAAIRNVSERLNDDPNRPDLNDVAALIAIELREVPMIMGKPLIQEILYEYLRQLRYLDIGQVQYY
jgi:hypothetical protein